MIFGPSFWRDHSIDSIFKRKNLAQCKNYRGIQLSSQVSKIIEQAISSLMMPRIIYEKLFGLLPFAYSPEHSSRDALLFMITTWLILNSSGRRICLYCSDVSGAFDNVSKNLLVRKLLLQGLPANFVHLLSSWMSERRARVCIGGKSSRSFGMSNMVYQGTRQLLFSGTYSSLMQSKFSKRIEKM